MNIESDVRNLSKWLNEEHTGPIDRAALARVLAFLQQQPAPVQVEHCLWARNGNTPCPHTAAPLQEPPTDEQIIEVLLKARRADLEASGIDTEGLRQESVSVGWFLSYARAVIAAFTPPAAPVQEPVTQCMEHGECFGGECIYTTPPAAPVQEPHGDDLAVDRFAAGMKAKLAKQRAKGYGGWDDPQQCTADRLRDMLVNHVTKGDPVDVGNLAMMLWNRGEATTQPAAPVQEPVAWRAWFDADSGARWLFTLWPKEERLDVEWQPLYTTPPATPVQEQGQSCYCPNCEALSKQPATQESVASANAQIAAHAKRLALELECLLLSCKESAAVSKWWASAHQALGQYQDDIERLYPQEHVSPLGKD